MRYPLLAASILVLFLASCTPTPVPPTPTPTAASAVTATPSLTPSPTSTPTSTPTPTVTPTVTPTPTPLLLVEAGTPLPGELNTISSSTAGSVSGLASWRMQSVTDLSWAPTDGVLAVADTEEIAIYDAASRERLQLLQSDGIVSHVAFSPGGALLTAGVRAGSEKEGYFGRIRFWRVSNWEDIGPLHSDPREVSSIAYSQNGDLFAAGFASPIFENDVARVWLTSTWEISRTLELGTVLQLAFSPTGEILATSPDRYAIKLWQMGNGELLDTFHTSFTGAVNALLFSPDNRLLASGHYDGTIRLWDLDAGQELIVIQTGGVIESLAFSPDGLVLASGESWEGHRVHLWDVIAGDLLQTLEGHERAVVALEFSPDGRYLASGSYDGEVRLWGIRP